MRRARGQDGKRLFAVEDFLTAQQITSYFSRMAAKRKNVTEAETDTEERETFKGKYPGMAVISLCGIALVHWFHYTGSSLYKRGYHSLSLGLASVNPGVLTGVKICSGFR